MGSILNVAMGQTEKCLLLKWQDSKILQTNKNQINTDLFLYSTVVVVNIVGEVIANNVVFVDDIVVGWGV